MTRRFKVKRNDACPCESGKKYEKCCEGHLDWNKVYRSESDWRQHLSIRGRNIYFVNRLRDILQLDTIAKARSLKDYKNAFTANAVKKIHEAVMEIWPPDIDIVTTLGRASTEVSGLYIGDYGPEYIFKGIVRHSIYANKILIIDPFVYPRSVRDQFNPIIEPEQYRSQTLKNTNFWFALLPWIEAGIVEVIRTPADFDHQLNWESLKRQQKKFEENMELKKALEDSVQELEKRHMDKRSYQQLLLGAPDFYIKRLFDELDLGKNGYSAEAFLEYINRERERDPDFLEPIDPDSKSGHLHMMTTGSSYDIAQLTASITGSYLVTDLPSKWREIEIDRDSHHAENKVWTPFSKAIQNANLRYLNGLRLDHALTLRMEGRLHSLRTFLRRVWKDACTEDPFDETNAYLLAEELHEKVQEAEEEWKKIDQDLIKIIGVELSAGFLAAGPLIAAGHAEFLAAAAVTIGATTLAASTAKRRRFPDRFPAAFFMKVSDVD